MIPEDRTTSAKSTWIQKQEWNGNRNKSKQKQKWRNGEGNKDSTINEYCAAQAKKMPTRLQKSYFNAKMMARSQRKRLLEFTLENIIENEKKQMKNKLCSPTCASCTVQERIALNEKMCQGAPEVHRAWRSETH